MPCEVAKHWGSGQEERKGLAGPRPEWGGKGRGLGKLEAVELGGLRSRLAVRTLNLVYFFLGTHLYRLPLKLGGKRDSSSK